jgi:hypothetical protein
MGVDKEAENTEPATKPQRAPKGTWSSLFVLGFFISLVLVSVWSVLPELSKPDGQHQTRWPIEMHPEPHPGERHRPDFPAAERHMRELAEALLTYRDVHGGGLRWPFELSELQMYEILPADFSLTGRLSGREVVYQPDIPTDRAPENWVLVHDVQTGWVYPEGVGRPYHGAVAAVVILGDGTVRTLSEHEMDQYAGLQGEFGGMR